MTDPTTRVMLWERYILFARAMKCFDLRPFRTWTGQKKREDTTPPLMITNHNITYEQR